MLTHTAKNSLSATFYVPQKRNYLAFLYCERCGKVY